MSLHKRIVVLMAVFAVSLSVVSAALAGSWSLTTASGVYAGNCNELPNGGLNCHGNLVSGSPEQVVINSGNCVLTLTPSGRANMNCR